MGAYPGSCKCQGEFRSEGVASHGQSCTRVLYPEYPGTRKWSERPGLSPTLTILQRVLSVILPTYDWIQWHKDKTKQNKIDQAAPGRGPSATGVASTQKVREHCTSAVFASALPGPRLVQQYPRYPGTGSCKATCIVGQSGGKDRGYRLRLQLYNAL
eukprot:1929245-Rhodomonas_salina.2